MQLGLGDPAVRASAAEQHLQELLLLLGAMLVGQLLIVIVVHLPLGKAMGTRGVLRL
jgi:hypothetical protein